MKKITALLCVMCITGCTMQQSHAEENQIALHAPIICSPTGISHFLRDTFNNPEYAHDVLPYYLDHVTQLLQHVKEMPEQKRAYLKSVIKLFGNKIKETPCIEVETFITLLTQIPEIVLPHIAPDKAEPDLILCQKRVYTILEETFLAQFDFFKEKPDEFLSALSNDIVTKLHKESALLKEDVTLEQLRQALIRFLDLCISKLVWDPTDASHIWPSVKAIAKQLERCTEQDIIADVSDLDDLYWSLLHRFCFFLDIAGADIPTSCHKAIQDDIQNQKTLLLELEEQEPCIEPKLSRLQRALRESETKKRAYENGILLS